ARRCLVPRTRSSHHIAAGTVANFGFKSGTRIIKLLVSFSIPKFAQNSRQMLANFGIRTQAADPPAGGQIVAAPVGRAGLDDPAIRPTVVPAVVVDVGRAPHG